MLGERENQLFLTRAALSTRGTQKQIPISSFVALVALALICPLRAADGTKMLKGTPDEGLKLEYNDSSLPGKSDVAKTDFAELLKTAPVLDVTAPGFSEKKARAWHERTAKLFSASLKYSSEEFQLAITDALTALRSAPKYVDGKAYFERMQKDAESLPAKTGIDSFAKAYYVQYATNWCLMYDAMKYAQDAAKKLGLDSDNLVQDSKGADTFVVPKETVSALTASEKQRMVAAFRSYQASLGANTFAPGIQPIDIIGRRMAYRFAKRFADQLEQLPAGERKFFYEGK